MAILKPVVFDGGMQRQILSGDVVGGTEILSSQTTAGSGTLTAALLTSGIINRTGPGAGYTDTTDTAQNIINALVAGYNYNANAGLSTGVAVQSGTTFRLRYINTVAFAMTLAAGSGVTITANGNVNVSSVKDYLLTVVNGTPTQIYAVNQVNASAVITGMTQAQTAALSVGMVVTGTSLSGSIISIQQGVGVTLSANASATLNLNTATFSPAVSIVGLGQMLL